MTAVLGVAGCVLALLIYAVVAVGLCVWSIVDLCNGHHRLVLDIIVLVVLGPSLLGIGANRANA